MPESHLESKGPHPMGEDTWSVIQATAVASHLDKTKGTDSLLPNNLAAPKRVNYTTAKLVYTWIDQKKASL